MSSNAMTFAACFAGLIVSIDVTYLPISIGIALQNMSTYALIISKNYRSIINYVIISSLSFILLTVGLIYTWDLNETTGWIALFGIAIKLSIFPFSAWSFPVYKTLNTRIAYWLIVITKVVYVALITTMPLENLVYSYLILALTLGSLVTINITHLIGLVIASGSIQIVYILLPILTENYVLAQSYFIIYICLTVFLLLLFKSNVRASLGKYLLYSILYAFSGIPPFIGFYTKIMVLTNFSNNPLLLMVVLSSVLVSYLYFSMADRWYNPARINKTYTQLPCILAITVLMIYALPIFISDFNEIIYY